MVQQDVLAVCCYLKGYNISMSPENEWLQQCIDYFKTENLQCSRTDLQEFVCQQWLLADLRVIQNRCLPTNYSEDERLTMLNGKYSVQVNWVRDIGKSSYSQLRNITDDKSRHNEIENEENPEEKKFETVSSSMLMLEMTDGVVTVKGIEYKPINKFTAPILPGTKMIITGPVECRRGVLLLQEGNVTILGGEVDSLLDVNSPVNVLARSLNLPESSVENIFAPNVTGTATRGRPASPVNNRQRNAAPLHSRHTAEAPPSNRYRDTTPLTDPTRSSPNEEPVPADFDDGFDEDDELLLQVPEEVLNATADEMQTVETETRRQLNSVSTTVQEEEEEEEEEDVVYSDDESDKELFLDNPMISQQIRLSSQFNRSAVKCTTQNQPAVNKTNVNMAQQRFVTLSNTTNKQNSNFAKPPVRQQIAINNKLSTPLSNVIRNTPTNSDRLCTSGSSFMSSTPCSSLQSSTPSTSFHSKTPFQNSSSLLSNNESNKQNTFSDYQNDKVKNTSAFSDAVDKKSLHDNIVQDIDTIEIEDDDDSVDSKVTEEIFGSVQRLSSKLRIVHSEWVLTASISDGGKTFDVKFASEVVDEIIGFSAAELEARRFETVNNPAVKEKVNTMLKNGQKELSTLSCAMMLEHSKDGDIPTVIKIMK